MKMESDVMKMRAIAGPGTMAGDKAMNQGAPKP